MLQILQLVRPYVPGAHCLSVFNSNESLHLGRPTSLPARSLSRRYRDARSR